MKRYGILGHKIGYSLSPRMHNAAFKFLGMDASYEVFDVEPANLEGFFKGFKGEGISGFNVTIPHKEISLTFLDEIAREVTFIGAVNTILVKEDGKIFGFNTDFLGFTKVLTDDLRLNPAGTTEIFVFGAGGAARSSCYSLIRGGARQISITDIDIEKAEKVATDLLKIGNCRVVVVPQDENSVKYRISSSDLVINATPCGMRDNDPELFDYGILRKNQIVLDLIYTKDTPLVKKAKEKGLKAINGLSMLLYQGAASFKIWTGADAPIDVMRKVLEKENREEAREDR